MSSPSYPPPAYQPASGGAPDPGGAPVPPAEPYARAAAPERRRRYSTAAFVAGLLTVCACGLLGWSAYTLLASVKVFKVILGQGSLVSGTVIAVFGLGAVVALIAFITSIVGVARSRARFVPALVLLAALVLPAVATGYGIQQGGEALYNQTLADAQNYIGQIDTGDVNALYDRFKAFGVNLPGRQQIIDVLNGVGRGDDGAPGGATPAPGGQSGAPDETPGGADDAPAAPGGPGGSDDSSGAPDDAPAADNGS